MLRKLRQWIAGSEIAALARDLEKLVDLCSDTAHRAEGLQMRLERLSNRVNMRLNRRASNDEHSNDQEIMARIAELARRGNMDPTTAELGNPDDPAFWR